MDTFETSQRHSPVIELHTLKYFYMFVGETGLDLRGVTRP